MDKSRTYEVCGMELQELKKTTRKLFASKDFKRPKKDNKKFDTMTGADCSLLIGHAAINIKI